ncbi:MAG TPA: glycosyltransferase family 1 protein [Pyrinomonadaceae bacterium]|nr:glycosyltransferase family 1 protein [Pyrinomonadaceae bacterium]
MLIGLDAIPLTEARTGVGHYTFELARALSLAAPSDEFELAYPSVYPPINLTDENEPTLPPNLRASRVAAGVIDRHWWTVGLPRHIRRSDIRLFHGTNYDVPLWGGCPTVLTIHDLSVYLHPATHLARRVRRARRRLPLMARAATMIITPTESVRREVCERLRVAPAKVVAVPEAPRHVFRPLAPPAALEATRRLGVGENFLLAVGTLEPRKNLVTLVRAFETVARSNAVPDELRLVITGKAGWLTRELFARVESSSVRGRVHFTGYVSEQDLRALYSTCAAFVYPSLYEGFGLPPLEAMACGAPVIASRIDALRETLGDESAMLFAPTDADALARSITELIGDRDAQRKLSLAGQRRAAGFTWERAARRTLEVYERALGRKKEMS